MSLTTFYFPFLLTTLMSAHQADIFTLFGSINDAYSEVTGAIDLVNYALDVGTYCESNGIKNCPTRVSICVAYSYFVDPIVQTYIGIAPFPTLAMNSFCLGEPSLKCCRRVEGGHCWSALNAPRPINCEGNPAYGITYTAGLCLAPPNGGAGCVCNYLPDCNSNELPDDDFRLGRRTSFYNKVGYALSGMKLNHRTPFQPLQEVNHTHGITTGSIEQLVIDFISWRGCDGYIHNTQILQNSLPSAETFGFTKWNDDPIAQPNEFTQDFVPARFSLPFYILTRFAKDVPQFWLKIDNIYSNHWDNVTRLAYLDDNDIYSPEDEILNYVDYGGLWLLQYILGDDWVLMTGEIVNETEPQNFNFSQTTDDLMSCQANSGRSSPIIFSSAEINVGTTIWNQVNIDFVAYEHYATMELAVSWGDSVLETQSYIFEAQVSLSHQYSADGVYKIKIEAYNEAGLHSLLVRTIEISGSPSSNSMYNIVGYPVINGLNIDLSIARSKSWGNTGKQVFIFEGTDQDINVTNLSETDFHSLGVFEWETPNDEFPIIVNYQMTAVKYIKPLKYIRFSCLTYDNYIYTTVNARISNVNVKLVNDHRVNATIDSYPLNEYIHCARRGNLFEDTQRWSVVELAEIDISLESSIVDENDVLDGYYYETIPGHYQFSPMES